MNHKWQLQNQANNNYDNGIYRCTYTPISKVKTVQKKKKKYSRLTQRTKEIKNYIYQLRTKLTKVETGKQNESKVPSGK